MEISDQLLCLFSEQIEQQDGSYVVEIPKQEFQLGDLEAGRTYQVAILSAPIATKEEQDTDEVKESSPLKPPVEEGETCVVEIEGIGEQGDGIARVERGYVVIVPDTEKGERVRIEITDVTPNVAFAEVVERLSYYE
jgi:predicted RNA-binding protein with TRAM domain